MKKTFLQKADDLCSCQVQPIHQCGTWNSFRAKFMVRIH